MFSYSGVPSPGTVDEIRFLLQDTNQDDPIFQNEEIQYYIDKMSDVNSSALITAALLAETAAARFARMVTISSDQTSIAMEQLQQKYEELALRLRAMSPIVNMVGTGPIVGGNNWDDWWYGGRKMFRMRAHDNIEGGYQDNTPDPWWLDYELGGLWTG